MCERWADLASMWLYLHAGTRCLDYATEKFLGTP